MKMVSHSGHQPGFVWGSILLTIFLASMFLTNVCGTTCYAMLTVDESDDPVDPASIGGRTPERKPTTPPPTPTPTPPPGSCQATSANQLPYWLMTKSSLNLDPFASDKQGRHYPSLTKSLTCGPGGALLPTDRTVFKRLFNVVREKNPERFVHAKGTGAYGYFTTTVDLSRYTKANMFQGVNKTTPVFVRLSTTLGERGTPDTVRDNRGFATKFFTMEGNLDLMALSLPVFPVRDAILFASFIHAVRRNPQTNLHDCNMMWDYISSRPETTNNIVHLFSDQGIPNCFTQMNAYGIQSLQLVNGTGQSVFARFSWRSNQGTSFLNASQAANLACTDPDYCVRNLYDLVACGPPFPSWTLLVQIVTVAEAESCNCNIFDITKELNGATFPTIEVGGLVLNKNVLNFYRETEQSAFCPGNMVNGIQIAVPDSMLQTRAFVYEETQVHRLGENFEQLQINRPLPHSNDNLYSYERDGFANEINYGSGPNYFPNDFGGPTVDPAAALADGFIVKPYTGPEDDFSQAAAFVAAMTPDEFGRLVSNLAGALCCVTVQAIIDLQLNNFLQVNPTLYAQLKAAIEQCKAAKGGM